MDGKSVVQETQFGLDRGLFKRRISPWNAIPNFQCSAGLILSTLIILHGPSRLLPAATKPINDSLSPSPPAGNMDKKTNDMLENRPVSMKELWDDAERRFRRDTGMDLRSKGKTSFDDCLDKITKLQVPASVDAPPTKASGTEKAKEVGLGILSFLKLLGGVAAEAADMTFPASGLVSNAVLFLLDIPGDLHDFHKAVDGLFETLGEGLSHFRIYDKIEQFTKIEDELVQAIHRLLISFVTICGLSINLRQSGRWKKFKGDAKRIIFRDDSGVKDEVDNFNALLEAHQRVQGTQTLKTVLETNDKVAEVLNKASETGQKIDHLVLAVVDMKDSADKRKADEERKETIAKIKEKLELTDSDRATSALKASKDICDSLWHERLPGTVSWVDNPTEQTDFHKWAERKESGAKPLFVLTGESNTGKSVIASAIVNRLRNIYNSPTRKLEKTFIASYFFPIVSGKGDTDKQPIHTALRCIALQLAEADHQYATALVKACDGKEDIKSFLKYANCQDLWQFLRLGNPSSKTGYYFIIDGLESLSESYQPVMADLFNVLDKLGQESRSVRVLITLKSNRAQSTFVEALFWNLSTQEVGKNDISKYIETSLKEDDILQGDDDYRKEKRMEIRDRLFNELSGNYFKVKTALEKIKSIVRKTGKWEDIVKVLNEADEDEQSISRRAIRDLETSLDPEEIEELNELLIWTADARGQPFTVDELEEALLLRFKVPSLLKLEKKIRGKYSKIFEISAGNFKNVFIREGILDLVRRERTGQRGEDDEAKFDVSITITKANLTKVQRFLWNLSMKLEATQDRFGFQQLEDKTMMHGTIQVNEFDSYMALLDRTFDLLADEPTKPTEAIATYLIGFLPEHLEALKEAPTSQPLTVAEKQRIGDGLYSIFATGDVIEKHWANCDFPVRWNKRKYELDTFCSWFKDPEVTSKLGRMDRRWLADVITSKDPYRGLLINIVTMLAKHLFCDREWDVLRPYNWIKEFVIWEPEPRWKPWEEEEEEEEPPGSTLEGHEQDRIDRLLQEHPHDTVQLVSAWCQEALGIKERDECWNDRLGEIYHSQNDPKKVVEILQGAPERETPHPKPLELLALSLANTSDEESRLPEACRIMELALKILQDEEAPDNTRISKNYTDLSRWYGTLGKLDMTMECLQKALVLAPDNYNARFDLLFAWLDKDNEQEALRLLQELVEHPAEPGSAYGTHFGQIIASHLSRWTLGGNDQEDVEDREFGKILSGFSGRGPEFARLVLQELDQAIDRSKASTYFLDRQMVGALLYFRGLAVSPWHYKMAEGKKSTKTTLDYWSECLTVVGDQVPFHCLHRVKAWLAAGHYEEALRKWKEKGCGQALEESETQHIAILQQIIATERSSELSPAKSYLTWYYTITNRNDAARDVLRDSMQEALDMLSDSEEYNDLDAFGVLAYILMTCGDALNALSAFSLLLPSPNKVNILSWILEFDEEAEHTLASELIGGLEDAYVNDDLRSLPSQFLCVLGKLLGMRKETPEKLPVIDKIREKLIPFRKREEHVLSFNWVCCECRAEWDLENRLNFCLCCHDKGFCDDCVVKLRSEKDRLKLSVKSQRCQPRHEMLAMPAWTKEGILEALRGNVLVGGILGEDSLRVGGEFVPIEHWLGVLKSEWGYVEREFMEPEAGESEVGEPAGEKDEKYEDGRVSQVDEPGDDMERHTDVVKPEMKVDAVVSTAVVDITPSA